MIDENELDNSACHFSSRSSPRSFDMLGGASSASPSSCVIVRCSLLLVRLSSRLVLLAFVPLVWAFLRRLRRVCLLSVPPYRRIAWLPDRSTSGAGRWRVASLSWFASVAVACCLPWRGRECGGAVFLSWVLLFAAVSMASAGGVISVVPVACRGPFYRSGVSRSPLLLASPLVVVVGRHGLIVIGCCRRGSVSSSIVVARRRFALLALGCRRHPCSPRGASAVDRFVDRFVDRLAVRHLAPPCLLCGGAAWRGGFSLVPLVLSVAWGAVFLVPFGSREAARLIRLLACRLGILRERALPLAWLVVAAFPPSPVSRAVCLCG